MEEQETATAEAIPVSREVQTFYEQHPYPPPVDDLDRYRRRWDERRRRADTHLFWPAEPYRKDRTVLIAGCGTSQAAKHALRWPEARVVGIDFSATSIERTEVLKRKYDLSNLELRRLPIERAGELGMRFDQVVCTGVLHHLPDPDAGLAALQGVLQPEGAMHLMVYAPYGRTGIYMLQEFCRRIGVSATTSGIHDLVATLNLLPPGHPIENLLREAPDFRDEAALADALLHPQDRAYSVPELLVFLRRGGLAFGRWLKQAPYSPRCGVVAKLPQVLRMQNLPASEQYAAVELFRGTMLRHSAIVYRDDSPLLDRQISFANGAWLNYVPIKIPDTVCVEERLPPGAAAVLLNRTHSYRDLLLPIDADEKRIFDHIDGERSIGAIVDRSFPLTAPTHLERARTLFKSLWEYDQVVFDASQQPTDNG